MFFVLQKIYLKTSSQRKKKVVSGKKDASKNRVLRLRGASYFQSTLAIASCVAILGLGHLGLFAVTVSGIRSEFLLDAEKLVVLGHTVGA